MYVRLAFAVAAFLEPEILIVDEVLAVGDAEFQKKAIGKMQDISREGGRTVLFVSHNMAAVKSLCTRGIVMENGKVAFEGGIDEAVDLYLNSNERLDDSRLLNAGFFDFTINTNKKIKDFGILNVQIFCDGKRTNSLLAGKKVEFHFVYSNQIRYNEPVLGIVINDDEGLPILGLNNRNTGDSLKQKEMEGVIILTFPVFRLIKSKKYKVDIYFGDQENNVDTITEAFYFNVLPSLDTRKPIQEKLNYFYDSEIKFQ
jgi:lipopolysaccharide transport system ATP-binding protein